MVSVFHTLILIQLTTCLVENSSEKTRYFKKCSLLGNSTKTFSCTMPPTNISIVSSKLSCAKQCASISTGQNSTFGNQLPSSLYTINGSIVKYKNFSFTSHQFYDMYPVVGDIQVCLGFNYQLSTGLCQLFDNYCPLKNLLTNTDYLLGIYYGVVSKMNSKCYFGKIEYCEDIPGNDPEDSGLYWMEFENETYPVYCAVSSSGTKYMVIQRRIDGSVDFYRGWVDYENGFGNLDTEFWLGNHMLYHLTNRNNYKLRVELETFDGNSSYAEYLDFKIGPRSSNYTLTLGSYSGTAGDSMSGHSGKYFSTLDRSNNLVYLHYLGVNLCTDQCAILYQGAWWYTCCHSSNLNGVYYNSPSVQFAQGLIWSAFRGLYESMKACRMMITNN